MMPSLKPDVEAALAALETATNRVDWDACAEAFQHLAPSLSEAFLDSLVATRTSRYLQILRQQHPEAHSLRSIVAALTTVESTIASRYARLAVVVDALKSFWPEPGTNNLRGAINRYLVLIFPEHKFNRDFATTNAAEVVAGLVGALAIQKWGNANPDLWRRWFEQRTRDDFFILARYYASNPDVVAHRATLWSEVAADVSRHLEVEG